MQLKCIYTSQTNISEPAKSFSVQEPMVISRYPDIQLNSNIEFFPEKMYIYLVFNKSAYRVK